MNSQNDHNASTNSSHRLVQVDHEEELLIPPNNFCQRTALKAPWLSRTIDNGKVQMGAGCRIRRSDALY
jgi:hypothetical protein